MRNMRIAATFIVASILQIASPTAAAEEAVKGNGIFGRNRLIGDSHDGPQSASLRNTRPRRLPNGPIYHHGQLPNVTTLPDMEEGTLNHLPTNETNVGKKGVKGSRSEKVAPKVIYHEGYHPSAPEKMAVSGKGAKAKPVYDIDGGDGEDTMDPPEDYEYSGKMQKAKVRNPNGYNPKKYQSDRLPTSSPKELQAAKARKFPTDAENRTPTNNSDLGIVPDGTTTTDEADASNITIGEQDPVIRTLPIAAFHYTTSSTDAASVAEVEELATATAEVFTALFRAAFPDLFELKLIEYGALTDRLVKYKVELYFHDDSDAPTDDQIKAAAVAGFADQAIYNRAYMQRLGQMESSVYRTTSSVVFMADNDRIMEAQTASSDSSTGDGSANVYAPIVSGLAIIAVLGSIVYARRKLQPMASEEHEALKGKSYSHTHEDATDDGGTMMSDFRTVAFSEDGIEDAIPRSSQQDTSDLGSALDLELEQVMARMNELEEVSLADDRDNASQSSASSTSNLTDYGKHPHPCGPSDENMSDIDGASLIDEEVAHATMKTQQKKGGIPFKWKWSSSTAVSTTTAEQLNAVTPTTTPSHEENNDTATDQHSTQSLTSFKELQAQEDGMIEVVYDETAHSESDQVESSQEPIAVTQRQNKTNTTATVQQALASEAVAVFLKAETKSTPSLEEQQSNRFDKTAESSKPEWMNKKFRATGTNKFETQSRSSSCASNVILSQYSRSTVTTPCSIGTETDSNVRDCSFRSNTTVKDNPKQPAWVSVKLRPTSPKTDSIHKDKSVSPSTENKGMNDAHQDSLQRSSYVVEEVLQPMADIEHYDYDNALMQGSIRSGLDSIEDGSLDDDEAPVVGVEVKFEPAWMRKRPVSPVPLHQEPQVVEEDKHTEPDTSALPEWMRKFHTMGLHREDD